MLVGPSSLLSAPVETEVIGERYSSVDINERRGTQGHVRVVYVLKLRYCYVCPAKRSCWTLPGFVVP